MIWKRWKAFFADVSRKKIGIYAANAAFFLVLSLFPALMLLLSILSYTPLSQETLLTAVRSITPEAMGPLINYLVNELYDGSGVALLSVSAVTAMWSASRGVFSLMEGLNGIYDRVECRSYVYRRLLCLLHTVLLLLALLVTLVLYVFGQSIAHWLEGQQIPILRLLLYVIRLRWLVAGVFLTGVFLVLYKVFPNQKLTFRAVWPGAVLSAVGWLVFTQLFSFYVNNYGSFAMVYGSLATIAISMFWLYCCLCILFFSAVLNRYLDEQPQTLRLLFRKV